mmetsp:Transcript_1098/g.2232  ORF Transcript_1098/g.2232 Transcript_1098/m.2232 type:complete len:327 (+) Transcript_1098:694-1674(+)
MPKLTVLAELHLQSAGSHPMLLRPCLRFDEVILLELLAQALLGRLQQSPEMLSRTALAAIDLFEQLPERLHFVLGVATGFAPTEYAQGSCGSGANFTITLQQGLLGVSQVDANGQHLCPGFPKAVGLFNGCRNLRKFLVWSFLLVVHCHPRFIGHINQPHGSLGDTPHKIVIIIFQLSLRNDAEAACDHRLSSLSAIFQHGSLHLAVRSKRLFGVLPKAGFLHSGQLDCFEQVTLAMCTEHKHSNKSLFVVPGLAAVDILNKEELMNSQHSVIWNPAFCGTKVGFHKCFHVWQHLGSAFVFGPQLLFCQLSGLDTKLTLQEAEELI